MKENKNSFILTTKYTEEHKEFGNGEPEVKIPKTLKFLVWQKEINCDNIFIYF